MASPKPQITQDELDERIQSFLKRKDARFPEMKLLEESNMPDKESADRGDSVWFRTLNPFN